MDECDCVLTRGEAERGRLGLEPSSGNRFSTGFGFVCLSEKIVTNKQMNKQVNKTNNQLINKQQAHYLRERA